MARGDGLHWEEEDLLYSSRDSDDSPILFYRHEKYGRYTSHVCESKAEERERRSTFSVLAKFFLFSTAMILFCVLLYIPVYNKANDQVLKPAVAGWSINTNRDTKIYVQPENVTTLHEPRDICSKSSRKEKNKLFLLIFVCSATSNFEERSAIRETWGNYTSYLTQSRIFHAVKEKYKDYNSSLERVPTDSSNISASYRIQRDISGFSQLLPELAKAIRNSNAIDTDSVEEKRFDDERDDDMLQRFDMNKVLGDQDDDIDFDYEYGSNIMKIPPKGYEDSPDLGRIMSILKQKKIYPNIEPELEKEKSEPDFKVVFLLGIPPNDNNTDVQAKIEREVEMYGDIIQEGFIDSYNNLTLKSIMMLKWVTNMCNESVRYILKSDDDLYLYMPNLISSLRSRAKAFDDSSKGKEYLLVGNLICGARPVQDSHNKWYSPRYMYRGRIYPPYVSGTAYAMSVPAVRSLYAAALSTEIFHIEDVFLTGICAMRSMPRVVARPEPRFSLEPVTSPAACFAHARLSLHRVAPPQVRSLHRTLLQPLVVDSLRASSRGTLLSNVSGNGG